MCKVGVVGWSLTPALILLFGGLVSAATADGDLSRYRSFQFGTDLQTIAGQITTSASQAKVIQSRPALIQELEWRPQGLGPSNQIESVKEVVFSFYKNELYRIVITYDRYEIEGLTAEDLVDGVSMMYGPASRVAVPVRTAPSPNGDQDELIAVWQDPEHRFELIRSAFGPSFRLTGVLKNLEAPVQTAIDEAKRLDDQEAPQREARQTAREEDARRVNLDKARILNKPRFRP
jgi:hypothetical protein